MTRRRDFLAHAAGALGALTLAPASGHAIPLGPELARLRAWLDVELPRRGPAASPERLADDEAFWARVRQGYALHRTVVNLDHGWTNPAPSAAVDELARGARVLEALPAEELTRLWEQVTDGTVRRGLAETMGVPPAEIALVRNATEALDTVLLGVPLRAGDEVVCSPHDYYAMLDALAEVYEAAIGPRTRLVLLTHPSNLTGQLLPVRRIAAAAHRAGAEVVVDGAQSLGLLEEPVAALDCDYYGASAHKWLGLPVGLGVLWMRPAHVAKVWPLVPPPPRTTGMARFEWIGTGPEYVAPAGLPALALHRSIGAARKAARLRYLTTYWRTRVAAAVPGARFYTTEAEAMSCGLCTVELPGVDAKALQQRLRERDHILVQAMEGNRRAPEIRGLRVSPNVYTTPAELDRFVAAVAAGR